jgi:signal transduction histidine kinase
MNVCLFVYFSLTSGLARRYIIIGKREVCLMTIKRRLFVSNIMMIVIPVILGISITCAMQLALMKISGVNIDDLFDGGEHFSKMTERTRSFSEKWPHSVSLEQIQSDMERMCRKISKEKDNSDISFAVFLNGERMYAAGNFTDTPLLVNALSKPGSHYFILDRICLYTADAGEYKIVLMNANYRSRGMIHSSDNRSFIKTLAGFSFALVVIIILATTRFLTRKVFESIATPLDTLVYGVHQIRDGNLSYRIDYSGKDEFSAVCADFNEMAERLLDMVNRRQKDEENRKELVAGISHDLRTPLTSILTYVEGIEIGLASNPQIERHYLDTIKNKAKDLEHIVRQLFLLSKLDIGEFPMRMKRINIGNWLSDFVDNASEEYGQKGLKVELAENAHGAEVLVDSVQLGNVLTNIMENSLRYVDKEQKITRVACRVDSKNAVIALSDNGPGVPGEALDKLFHMFYRGDKARRDVSQGSGLGLAISAKIIERFGGTIKAENISGGGLSVTVTLPIMEEA